MKIKIDRDTIRKYAIPFAITTAVAIIASVIILIVVNAALMKIPMQSGAKSAYAKIATLNDPSANVRADYNAITERNLFRAKLQIEIPKPKSEKEIEEEMLTGILKDMALKGVWLGQQKGELYAVIDRGGQKGVWTYEAGEVIEKGLVVSDIKQNSVLLKKDDFGATLKLFAKGFERVPVTLAAATSAKAKEKGDAKNDLKKIPAAKPADYMKDVKKEGNAIVISKTLIEKIEKDNSIIMSAVAVKGSLDKQGKANGFKIVSVDKGSLAEKIGVTTNDVVQEVNGFKLNNSNDVNKAQQTFKNATKFEVKVLRGNKPKTLYYEIR